MSDLTDAITRLADAAYDMGWCDERERHQIGAAMVLYSQSDELRALVTRAGRIEDAARVYLAVHAGKGSLSARDAQIALEDALEPVGVETLP